MGSRGGVPEGQGVGVVGSRGGGDKGWVSPGVGVVGVKE